MGDIYGPFTGLARCSCNCEKTSCFLCSLIELMQKQIWYK